MTRRLLLGLAVLVLAGASPGAQAPGTALGYYRFPALSGSTVVFEAEGDLWRVPLAGGVAQRLTSHPAEESNPQISPDGRQVAYSARYEGPEEVYVLPLTGGTPRRLTWDGGPAVVVGWTPGGAILYGTNHYATLPSLQLFQLDPATSVSTPVPLAEAADGAYDANGTLFFTRLPFQGSHTRRYQGGTAQQIWSFAKGAADAVPLTASYAGTSKTPMLWQGRVYFASDRDGTMNLWSMKPDGSDLVQLTRHADYDLQSPSLSEGRIVYQHGADIRVYDIAARTDAVVPITLVSDFDQLRERWIAKPFEWTTSVHLSPTGDRVVATARGQVFVMPAEQGRRVEASRGKEARWRSARFMPDGKTLVGLSDESGEVEFWTLPANGVGTASQLTTDGDVLRWDGLPSPDGKRLAHTDKDQRLWVLDLATKKDTKIAENAIGDFDDLAWSPDSRLLAFTAPADNLLTRVFLWEASSGRIQPVTSDRYDSYSPAWSADGRWLYLLSDRHFESLVGAPWGSREPEPFFDHQTKAYLVAMAPGLRSPFRPDDELNTKDTKDTKDTKETKDGENTKATKATKGTKGTKDKGDTKDGNASAGPNFSSASAEGAFKAVLDGIEARLEEVPLAPGNYGSLSLDEKRLYFVSRDAGRGSKRVLKTMAIDNTRHEVETFLDDVQGYELSADRKKVLIRRAKDLLVVDAGEKAPKELDKSVVPLDGWQLHFDIRDEFRQMFAEAWRLERDYFYDRGMHGLDWKAVRAKYAPLVDRVTDREELSDVLGQMVSELSALHIFVYGGDMREGRDDVWPGSLGARVERDEANGGFRVAHVYRADPDSPDRLSPLARPGVDVHDGDVIQQVNGVDALSAPQLGELLRGQADQQVLLRVKPAAGGPSRDVIVVPLTRQQDATLRYDDWEYSRRMAVEKAGGGRIGYVHLRAMGPNDIAQWTREFYPVYDRAALVIDVRHNRGGNIDSWLLARLLRKAWFYWQPRIGKPIWNMQFAFRGHIVVLMDQQTASDGEAFSEGFRSLGLGKLIGMRTWGGEIWLSSSNVLVDRGIATAAEMGVYGPEGAWLIEGHGVDPDIVVDNLPHATYEGKDAQLDAAVQYLDDLIRREPVPVPPAPAYPIKRTPPPDANR